MKVRRSAWYACIAFLCVACWTFSVWAGGSQQTSGLTAQNILDRSRSLFNGKFESGVTDSFWSDTNDLLLYLNLGLVDVAAKTRCMDTTQQIVLQTGVTTYAITPQYINLEKAIYSGATTSYDASTYRALEVVPIDRIGHSENIGSPSQIAIWKDYVIIDPMPSSSVSGYKVTLYLSYLPSGLTINQAIPTPAIYDLALTHFVASMAFMKNQKLDLAKFHKQIYLTELTMGIPVPQTVEAVKQ